MPALGPHSSFLLKVYAYLLVVGVGMFMVFDTMPFLLDRVGYDTAEANEITRTVIEGMFAEGGGPPSLEFGSTEGRVGVLFVLSFYFIGTVLLMVPITWVYMYTNRKKYGRNLITALIILPICATATVWLIQDSLPLAFGLAALVSAVRFRIRLRSPLDGIYIFAAISVGLASGVAHLGVGYLMVVFFVTCAMMLWVLGYGRRPEDEEEDEIAPQVAPEAAPAADTPVQSARIEA